VPEPPPIAPPAEPAPHEPPGASVPIDLTPIPKAEPSRASRIAQRPESEERAEPAAGDWRRSAGRWCTGGGAAMLVAGAVVGLTGSRLGDALSDRYAKGALRPGDAKLYDRVDQYETIANALFVAGGVTAAAGLGFFAFTPTAGGAAVAVGGTF
jgi:hypothetical protein